MTVTERPRHSVGADVYHEIQHFYARQMQLLDDGRVVEWADTFTSEGVFAANAHPEPTRGRSAIAAAARAAHDQLAAAGVRRRHWLGMVAVDGQDGTKLRARCYALIFEIPRGGPAVLRLSTLCEDELERAPQGGWLVRHRAVTRDDLA
ncbi:nuclear transport factor 2 family protein [Streptomyces canus]|uniref:nuclear transport factor 2 family protein n=1 Tax=Streptomyces canus TaxID=58343 RepID=UPI0022529469|nr:nuclear transport factor 2 family protein [Streptomyces canus]MCX4856330.1 nuclear transport factor 2 family protein [Streptomyces canus]WSW38203.1 nuclear transport factor 2 family protein [Streptomyces canus]